MVRSRVAVLLFVCCFASWCLAQDQPTVTTVVNTAADPTSTDSSVDVSIVPALTPVTVYDDTVPLNGSVTSLETVDQNGNPITSAASAGPQYVASFSYGKTDQTLTCLRLAQGGRGVNCWTHIQGGVYQIATGAGITFGLTASNVWKLHESTVVNSTTTKVAYWTVTSLPPVKYIAMGKDGTLYGLNPGGGCDGTPYGYNIFVANSSLTGWSAFGPGGCLIQISTASDGTIVGVNGQNTMYWLPANGTWHQLFGTGGWKKIVAIDQTLAYAINTSNAVHQINPTTGGWTYLNGWCSDIAVSTTDELWCVGGSNGVGNVYSWTDGTAIGSWKQYVGFVNQIAMDADNYLFGVATNTTPYHFNRYGLYISGNTSGSYDCSNWPNGCPLGAIHTGSSTVSFAAGGLHGSSGVTYSVSGSPTTYLNATANEIGSQCDLFFGDPNSIGCKAAFWGRVICTAMGTIFSFQPPVQFTPAQTKSSLNGMPTVQPDDSTNCPLADHCAAGIGPFGDPPLAHFSIVNQRPAKPFTVAACYPFYNLKATCVRERFVGGSWGTWHCSAIPEELISFSESNKGTYDGSLGQCTGPINYWNSLP